MTYNLCGASARIPLRTYRFPGGCVPHRNPTSQGPGDAPRKIHGRHGASAGGARHRRSPPQPDRPAGFLYGFWAEF